MGIVNENDRSKILEAVNDLPHLVKDFWSKRYTENTPEAKSKSIADLDQVEDKQNAKQIEDWLTSIGLACYINTFRKHLYTDLDRIARIWEIELTAVLEITKPGHRRRILASVDTSRSQLLQAVSVGDGLNDLGNDRLVSFFNVRLSVFDLTLMFCTLITPEQRHSNTQR